MTQQLEYIEHMVELLANKGLAPTIHIHDVHDNQIENYYAAAEPPQAAHHGRLSLFITDESKLKTFLTDLSVCESTADVCRAVVKLSGGRMTQEYMSKDFAATLLPYLKFSTTTDAIYQALKRK